MAPFEKREYRMKTGLIACCCHVRVGVTDRPGDRHPGRPKSRSLIVVILPFTGLES
jgi:hypothetical protein